jgi:hypothetical protein
MPVNVLALLVLFWVILATAGYWFGFRNPVQGVLGTLFQGTFFVSLFILIPVTLYVLWGETRPDIRLQAHNIVPHPSLEELITEPNPWERSIHWVFLAKAPARDILDFYRRQSNRKGWAMGSDRTVQLVLTNKGESLTISAEDTAKGSVVSYLLTKE